MKTLTARIAAVSVLFSAQMVAAQTPSSRVDEMFTRWSTPDSPGAAVLIMQDGQIVHAKGYGMASLEQGVPIKPSTIFDIASLSKQFCAMSIALLEADGKLSLADDIHKYVPELANFGRTITINHLVHHTSGIRDWPQSLQIAGWSYEDVMSFDQILRFAFKQRELNFNPGSEYTYSNTGYNLLALVVARVSGKSFREFTDERIFKPLGMTNTHFADNHNDVIRGRAESYRQGPDAKFYFVPDHLTALGSSSLFTTAEDLAKWVTNFEKPTVGNAKLITRLHERGVLTKGDTIAYAFGQNVETYRGVTRVSHGGSWAGYRTALYRYPQNKFAVIILANTPTINPVAMVNRIADLYLADKLGPIAQVPAPTPAASTSWVPDAASMKQYVGRYDSDELDTFWTMSNRNGKLFASHFRIGDVELQPVERNVFRAGIFGDVRFVRDESGQVIAFTANAERVRNLRFHKNFPRK